MFGVPVSQVTPQQRQLAKEYLNKIVKEYLERKDSGCWIKYCLIVSFLIILLGIFALLC
jgi:hypothetical protein